MKPSQISSHFRAGSEASSGLSQCQVVFLSLQWSYCIVFVWFCVSFTWVFKFSAVGPVSVLLLSLLPGPEELMHLLGLVWESKLNHAGVGWRWARIWSSRNGPGNRTRKSLCSRDELKGLTSRAWRKQSCCDLCRKFKPAPARGRGARRRTARLWKADGLEGEGSTGSRQSACICLRLGVRWDTWSTWRWSAPSSSTS